LSEYYRLRRSQITDLTGLIFFVVGWIGAAPFAWPHIKRGFESGNPTKGIFYFAAWAFGSGIALGVCGMGLGMVGGRLWEALHRVRRNRVDERRPATVAAVATITRSATPVRAVRAALPPLRFEAGPVGIEPYLALARLLGETGFDRAHAAGALNRSSNVTAWDGERLVGIARVVSDGYFFAALAEVLVDPAFQRRGLGRDLLNRAFERSPRGILYIGAPFGNSAFFDAVGCERGLTGFTMRRPSKSPPAS
jgi:GNAT superfamily N-acetyltransferase